MWNARDPVDHERAKYGRLLFLMVVIAIILRLVLAMRPGLWGDEIFSLAMATGHSLEHPAASAVPALGDYVEAREALPPSTWRAYLAHDEPAAGPDRIVRAVFLSDSSPPLYYLLLSAWTRIVGTSDAALRTFSALFAIASLPLIFLVGRMAMGSRAAGYATFLFAFAPLSLYYSAEGRMYSLAMFLALLLVWASMKMESGGNRWPIAWGVIGGVALLTHYFLSFVWAACLLWLFLDAEPSRRLRSALAGAISLILALPWYVRLPASLDNWRVTAGWLDTPITVRRLLMAPPYLTWEMFSPSGLWGGSRGVNLIVAACMGLIVLIALKNGVLRGFLARRPLLPFLWLCGSLAGLIVFDVLQTTRVSEYVRYALPGLPAAMLLAGYFCSRIPDRAAVALVSIVALVWSAGIYQMLTRPARWLHPYPDIAARLSSELDLEDLIVVQSIPSGVLGVARYMTKEVPIASWVTPLATWDAEADMPILLADARCKAALVKIHDFDAGSAERWLEDNVEATDAHIFSDTNAEIRTYGSPSAPTACRS